MKGFGVGVQGSRYLSCEIHCWSYSSDFEVSSSKTSYNDGLRTAPIPQTPLKENNDTSVNLGSHEGKQDLKGFRV